MGLVGDGGWTYTIFLRVCMVKVVKVVTVWMSVEWALDESGGI